jgi:CubicO group peptidase (beta-lactamase class C family)
MNSSDQSPASAIPSAPFDPPPFMVPGFRQPGSAVAGGRWNRAVALDRAIDQAISSRQIVGTVVIAALNGDLVYRRAAGYADRESGRAVRESDIFRLASMTKPVVAVAALALVDAGKLHLDDPVTTWLPQFRPRVADGREPVITIRHLLTHTAGLGYGFLEPPDGAYHRLMAPTSG